MMQTAAPEPKSPRQYNALKHGITSAALHLREDEQVAYDLHLEAILKQYRPATDAESALVQSIADHQWQIQRACVAQINVMACAGAAGQLPDLDPRQHLDLLTKTGRTLNNYVLYETRLRKRVTEDEEQLAALQSTRQAAQTTTPAPAKAAKPGPVAVPPAAKREDRLVFSAVPPAAAAGAPPRPQAGA